jgi:hypothetical protein
MLDLERLSWTNFSTNMDIKICVLSICGHYYYFQIVIVNFVLANTTLNVHTTSLNTHQTKSLYLIQGGVTLMPTNAEKYSSCETQKN